MFSSYPDEWPGAGLLLLRAAIAAVLLVRGIAFFASGRDLRFGAAAIGFVAISGAILLVAGYFTRLGAVLVSLTSLAGIFFWSTAPSVELFDSRLTAAMVGVVAAALLCLGPGAFSLDARFFGRQEIVFPEDRTSK